MLPSDQGQPSSGAGHSDGHDVPPELAVFPAKDVVLFPLMMVPLSIVDPKLVQLGSEASADRKMIGLFAQRNQEEGPTPDNLYSVGTAARIERMLRLPDGSLQVLLHGVARIRLIEITDTEPYSKGRVEVLEDVPADDSLESQALQRNLLSLFQKIVSLSPNLPEEVGAAAASITSAGRLCDFVATGLNLTPAERQDLLETLDVLERLRKLTGYANKELDILEIGSRIQSQMKEQVDKAQREYMLRQQLRAIQQELGEVDERSAEIKQLREKLQSAGLSEEAQTEVEREIQRLESMPKGSPEEGMVRTYLEWMLSLPWSKSTVDIIDIERAAVILDEDHYDLEKVKERILEYLAVSKLRKEIKGPILCFAGPPGVGKTSLGQSIARALGRNFIRMSLGGIRDEAEIRGHRRTYIGAMPGRIIQGIRRAGSNNPVFMLDEVDKLAVGIQGDPAAALLEVLDPAQNGAFVDLYLGVPFDLSQVIFIATANVLDAIPPALRDRMEVMTIAGYTDQEKLHIAERYLVPRQIRENGLTAEDVEIRPDALMGIIEDYTREAGVRNLEREIASVCRKVARKIAKEGGRVIVNRDDLETYLGPRRLRHEVIEEADEIGVATGMAWTPVGGDILFVEATVVPGRGHLTLTGQLGDVMKESAQAALTYARSRAQSLNVPEGFYEKSDIHIHVPAGAVPKDGPSAGVTMGVALISAISRQRIRKDVAMTGEITLRGKVLPVGGIKEKVLAAHRARVRTVVLPKDNEKDLTEVPDHVRNELDFVPVGHMDQVLPVVLLAKQGTETVVSGA
ncbi:MAG: endopeptidase La [Chloroflexota bacterium]|nr:MAG: endopeptidase La [Chloroflexota bacterium]